MAQNCFAQGHALSLGQPPPTTTQCRGIKTLVLALIWYNSEGPFQLRALGSDCVVAQFLPASDYKSTPKGTSCPQIPISEAAYQGIPAENPTLALPLLRVSTRELGSRANYYECGKGAGNRLFLLPYMGLPCMKRNICTCLLSM